MTALSTDIPTLSSASNQALRLSPSSARFAIDTIAEDDRKHRNPAHDTERAVQRLTLAELNERDAEDLRRRFQASRRDSRPPVVKALDLIDAPRNVVANVLFPGTAKEIGRQGDRATFGLPRVMFSDALESLGVENQVARGVVGFVGDVALDPLTYLGGTGAAVRLTGKTAKGAGVTLSRTGRRVVNRSAQEAVQGGIGSVRNEAGRNLLRGLGYTDERLARIRAGAEARGEDAAAALRAQILGRASRPRASEALRKTGFDQISRGGRLERFARMPVSAESSAVQQARVRAATDFAKRFQRGSTDLPGINLTRGAGAGSEIAHIPFTDVALRVPAFTREGTERLANVARATAAADPASVQRAAGTTQALGVVRGVDQVVADLQGAQQRIAEAQSELAAGSPVSAVLRPGEEIADQTIARTPQEVIQLERQAIKELRDEVRDLQVRLAQVTNDSEIVSPAAAQAPGVVQAQAAEMRRLRSAAERANAIADQHETLIGSKLSTPGGELSVREIRRALRTEEKRITQEVRDLVERLGHVEGQDEAAFINARMDELRREMAANQLGEHIDLIMASDEEFEAFEGVVDALHTGAAAASEAAIAAEKSLVDLGSMTDLERGAAMLARSAIGSDSVTQGMMLITPFSQVMRQIGGPGQDEKIGRTLAAMSRVRRQAFQNREAAIHEWERLSRAMAGPNARALEEKVRNRVAKEIKAVLKDFGIGHEHFAAADELVAAMQVRVLNRMAQEQGIGGRGFNTFAWLGDEGVVGINDAGHGVDEFGNEVMAPWARVIDEAISDGVLSEKVNPGIQKRLEEVATNRIREYADLADEARRSGLLDHVRAIYVPNIPTDDLAEIIAIQGRHGPSRAASGAEAAQEAVESFQKARTSDQVRVPVRKPDGSVEWRRFFGWEIGYLTDPRYSAEALAELAKVDEEAATFFRETKEAVETWQNMTLEERLRYPPRPTDPFELNSLVGQGRLAHITHGADLPRSAFETSSTLIAARRQAQHQRALSKQRIKEAQAKLAVFVDSTVWESTKNAAEIKLSNGATARVIRPEGTGDRPWVVEIGGARYRPLSGASVRGGTSNALYGRPANRGVPARVALYPEQTAEFIERTQGVLSDPKATDAALRVMEKLNGLWKTTTLAHPSWWIGNVIGNTILGQIALSQHGVRPDAMLKHAKPLMAMMLARGNDDKLREITLTLNGQRIRGDEFMDMLAEVGVIGPNKSNEVAVTVGIGQDSVRASRPGIAGALADADRAVSDSHYLSKLPSSGQKMAKASVFGGKQFMAAIGAWFRFNRATDDVMRAATYAALVDNGVPQADAVASTIRNLFDYNDLSKFENKALRNTFPFYVWAKESLVHQVNLVARNPIYAGLAPKTLHAIEESLVGDQALPDHQRPAWMRENLAVQLTTDPEKRIAFTAGTLLPQEQLFRSLATLTGPEGAQDFLNFMVSSSAPPLKVPTEIGFGQEAFTHRTIGPTSQDADLSVAEAVSGQFRPFREIGNPFSPRRGAIASAADRGVGEAVGRALIGGRIQPMSDSRSRFNLMREVQTESENIRRAIRLAEREGDAGLSQRARVSLLLLYQDALNAGLEEVVPKWAAKQIREFGVSSAAVGSLDAHPATGG